MKAVIVLTTVLLLLLGLTISCAEKRSVSENSTSLTSPQVDSIIAACPKISVSTDSDLPVGDPKFSDIGNGERMMTTEKRKQATFDSLVSFNPNTGALWPGAVIQGASLPSGTLTLINLPRSSGELTISSLTFGKSSDGQQPAYSRVVDSPTYATVQQGMQDLLAQTIVGNTPARIAYSAKDCYSLEQGLLEVGLSASYMGGDLSASLHVSTNNQKSLTVVKLTQAYYDISFVRPAHASQFFRNPTASELQPFVSTDPVNPPAYVANVTYGRMLFVAIASQASASDVRAAIDASYNGGTASGSLHLSDSQQKVLSQSEISVLVLGGSAPSAARITGPSVLPAIQKFIEDGANFSKDSPGVPIAYVCKYLSDDSIAKVSFAANYEINTMQDHPLVEKKILVFWDHYSGLEYIVDHTDTNVVEVHNPAWFESHFCSGQYSPSKVGGKETSRRECVAPYSKFIIHPSDEGLPALRQEWISRLDDERWRIVTLEVPSPNWETAN